MSQIIPAILAKNEQEFRKRLSAVEDRAETVQIDVMDGRFVPNTSWCDLDTIGKLYAGQTHGSAPTFELHLMIEDPTAFITQALTIHRVQRILWHIESVADHHALLTLCHDHGCESGLALSPPTPIDTLEPYMTELDEILILGAEPGFSGKTLDPQMIKRAHDMKKRWPSVTLGFDVGVNRETIPVLREAGVSRLCAASAVFGHGDPATNFKELQSLVM